MVVNPEARTIISIVGLLVKYIQTPKYYRSRISECIKSVFSKCPTLKMSLIVYNDKRRGRGALTKIEENTTLMRHLSDLFVRNPLSRGEF